LIKLLDLNKDKKVSDDIRIFTDEELLIRNEGLQQIKHILDTLEIDFFLIMGILLGAIRENDFIKWDWDVELGVFTDSVIDRADEIKNVFIVNHFDAEIVNRSFEKFKINLFYKDNKYTLWGLYTKNKYLQRGTFRFPIKHFTKFDKLEFRGEWYKIPNDAEKLLSFIYGDWRTPKKTIIKEEYFANRLHIKSSIFKRIFKKVLKVKDTVSLTCYG